MYIDIRKKGNEYRGAEGKIVLYIWSDEEEEDGHATCVPTINNWAAGGSQFCISIFIEINPLRRMGINAHYFLFK